MKHDYFHSNVNNYDFNDCEICEAAAFLPAQLCPFCDYNENEICDIHLNNSDEICAQTCGCEFPNEEAHHRNYVALKFENYKKHFH